MPTDKEKERVIRNIGLCSILNPVTVDVKRRELNRDLPQWKELLLKLSFWGLAFNSVYKVIGFFYILLWAVDETPVWEIIIHLTLAEASPLVAFWYYILFNGSPEVHATVVKLTLGSSKNADAPVINTVNVLLSQWQRFTLQDMIALFAPPMVFAAAMAVMACFLYAPQMRLLLYAAVPKQLDTPLVFALCMAEDLRCVLLVATTAMTVFPVQVLAFERINLSLTQLSLPSQDQRSGTYRQEQSAEDIRTLRELQLYVVFLNEVHSYIIFTFKIYCISMCIVDGYAAVARFSENYLFGVMYYVIFFDCLCLYSLIYDKAFQIPRHFDKALKSIMLRLRLNSPRGRVREHNEKRLRSVPRAGIKVGSFHTLERTSTLVFIDHVVANIVNMLVGW